MAAASDISWNGPDGTFNLRGGGRHLPRRRGPAVYCRRPWLLVLPGGRARFGEASDTALARELAEELGHELRVGDLAFAAENVFDGNGIQHEIGLYYHVAWPAALAPDDLRRGKEIGHRFCWMAVRTLGSVRFEPAGLIHFLQNRPDTIEHVILGRPEP